MTLLKNCFIIILISTISTLRLKLKKSKKTIECKSDWGAIMAGLTIAIIPALLVFLIFQKYFVRSLAGLEK